MLIYLYQLQDADYGYLEDTSFKIAVIDPDDSNLNFSQIKSLQSNNKVLYAYLSIGEAENYRDYWIKGNWSENPPLFLLNENPDWEGNYNVKFWDKDWQAIMLNRITELAEAGYNGAYLDIVDAYEVAQVNSAYDGKGNIREDMINFIKTLSTKAKEINPGFKIIPQNGVELLSKTEDNPLEPDTEYLMAIDGVGKELTWTVDDQLSTWASSDLEYLKLARKHCKFVLCTEYPKESNLQDYFINKSIENGFIPFVGDRALDSTIPVINYEIPGRFPKGELQLAMEPCYTGVSTNNNDIEFFIRKNNVELGFGLGAFILLILAVCNRGKITNAIRSACGWT